MDSQIKGPEANLRRRAWLALGRAVQDGIHRAARSGTNVPGRLAVADSIQKIVDFTVADGSANETQWSTALATFDQEGVLLVTLHAAEDTDRNYFTIRPDGDIVRLRRVEGVLFEELRPLAEGPTK
jgi:hypothetical protein